MENHVDVAAISETLFTPHMPEDLLGIDGYTLFSKCRTTRRGGGVAMYIKESVSSYPLTCISVPDHLECLWVKVRLSRLPKHVSAIAVCVVYSPPQSLYQDELIEHLIASSDLLRTKYPDIGLIILGDFNHLRVHDICLDNNLCQVVQNNTRGDAILDMILTNIKSVYKKPEILPPVSSSDHNCVLWSPKAQVRPPQCIKRVIRPMRESSLNEFGRWITTQSWQDVNEATGTDEKANAFYNTILPEIDRHFPMKTVKMYPSDKPWITPKIKRLICLRQKAFKTGKSSAPSKFYSNKVQREINVAKKILL